MSSSVNGAHMLIIPYPAPGHMIPLVDLTHHLAIRGLTITIMVTPKNLHYLNPLLSLHPSIKTLVLPFPPHPDIPAGVENLQDVHIDFYPKFSASLSELHDPIVQWFQTHPNPPVAILCDIFLNTWTHQLVSTLGIKHIGFCPVNANSFTTFQADVEHNIENPFFHQMLAKTMENWGFVTNSFLELESEKFDIVKRLMKHDRVWGVGPVLPIKAAPKSTFERGGPTSIPTHEVITWLDACQVDKSVVYVGFGSQITLTKQQMKAVADGLEKSGVRFIWAVKEPIIDGQNDHSVVPTGFEDRVASRGLVIRGWAPQAKILEHRAVGSYLTHCGWGSVLEGLLGGVLLVAWPMQADHFCNAKLFVDELGVAIRVCEGLSTIPDSLQLARILTESIDKNRPERIAFMELREKALNAIKEGGSSYKNLDEIANQLSNLKLTQQK